jgi:hypothetical protein
MRTNRFFERSIPLLFLIVTILAYGLLLPLTGFYWDDWPFAWIARFLGPAEFLPAFAGVRPFLGPIFFVTTNLIPPVPIYWQIFAHHSIPIWTCSLVCIKSNLASPQATGSHGLIAVSCISWL